MILQIILIVFLILAICFSFVLIWGAPFLPTLKKQIKAALDLAELKKGDMIIDLGCGDGRLLIAAAQRGFNGLGYELNPLMFLIAKIRTIRYRKQIKIVFGNFWNHRWPKTEAIYVFLLPKLMKKLDNKIIKDGYQDSKIITFAFKFPKRRPIAESQGVFLYDFKK